MRKYDNIPAERRRAISEHNRRIARAVRSGEEFDKLGCRVEREQSDKLGFDFERTYLGDVLQKSVYVQQENPQGTADNPILYSDAVPLIPNAYYVHDGTRKVWTGEATTGAAWDDERFVEF